MWRREARSPHVRRGARRTRQSGCPRSGGPLPGRRLRSAYWGMGRGHHCSPPPSGEMGNSGAADEGTRRAGVWLGAPEVPRGLGPGKPDDAGDVGGRRHGGAPAPWWMAGSRPRASSPGTCAWCPVSASNTEMDAGCPHGAFSVNWPSVARPVNVTRGDSSSGPGGSCRRSTAGTAAVPMSPPLPGPHRRCGVGGNLTDVGAHGKARWASSVGAAGRASGKPPTRAIKSGYLVHLGGGHRSLGRRTMSLPRGPEPPRLRTRAGASNHGDLTCSQQGGRYRHLSVSSYRGKQRTKRTSAGCALSAAAFRLVASGVWRLASGVWAWCALRGGWGVGHRSAG